MFVCVALTVYKKEHIPRVASSEAAECIHVREAKEALHHLVVWVDVLGLGSMTLAATVLTIGVGSSKRLLTGEHVVLKNVKDILGAKELLENVVWTSEMELVLAVVHTAEATEAEWIEFEVGVVVLAT